MTQPPSPVTLHAAIQLHQAGQLEAARSHYQALIAASPKQADAHHFLGLLEHQAGQPSVALGHFEAALALDRSKGFFFINYANLLKDLGQPENAERAYQQALTLSPHDAVAHYNLGHLYQLWGRLPEALTAFGRACELQPDFAQAWDKQAAVHLQQDAQAAARTAVDTALKYAPELASGWFHLADCLGREHQWPASREALERALALQPVFPEALNNLGMAYRELGLVAEARRCFESTLAQSPQFADPCINLAKLAEDAGQRDDAARWLQEALRLEPNSPQAHFAMGNFMVTMGREQEGAHHLRTAITLKPNYPEALNNLGNVLLTLQQHDEGLAVFQQAIACRADYSEAYANLGNLHIEQKFPDLAEAALLEALRINPEFAAAHSNLGNAYFSQGKIDQAIESYQRGIDLGQDERDFVPNYLFALNYSTHLSQAQIGAEHRRLCQQKLDPLGMPAPSFSNRPDPDRRLKIGYVSPDFWMHPVARFMLPLLEQHDRSGFEIWAYSTRLLKDGITTECERRVDQWREIYGMDDAALAQQIRADGIDILVDLTMHARECKPWLFARRPAPVQVSYLAYAGTTGLAAMDYRLTDVYLDPPGPTPGFNEEPLRLSRCWWTFQVPPAPHVIMPEGVPPPCLSRDRITFGSLNNFVKVNPVARTAWARILREVPDAHLLLHMKESRIRKDVMAFFVDQGVSEDRVEIIGYQNGPDYIRTYERIDIALDPFPFAGGTTTFDALWMGVPVVTLAGDRPVGRGGLSILSTLGRPEWVGQTIDDYVAVARRLAADRAGLAAIRTSLRDELRQSPLMDSAGFTREVEAHFRAIWRRWCAQAAG